MKTKRLIKRALLFSLMLTLLLAVPTFAATKKTKALKAYSKMLSKKKLAILPIGTKMLVGDGYEKYNTKSKLSSAYFAIAYIDNDSIPELVVTKKENYSWKWGGDDFGTYDFSLLAIYTWKKGKVRRIAYEGSGSMFNRPSFGGYYKKKGVYVIKWKPESNEGIFQDYYYKMNGNNKPAEILYYFHDTDYEYDPDEGEYDGAPDEYHVNRKVVSKVQYLNAYRKATSGTKLTRVIFRKNTKKNRKKYLK